MNRVWAFDLDGTLIGSVRGDVLRPHAVELLGRLVSVGITCVLWSAGGADYARRRAEAHAIDGFFSAFYDKGGRDDRARYTVDHFESEHRPHVFVDDAPDDMPMGAEVISVPQFIGGNPDDGALATLIGRLDSEEEFA